MKTEERGAEQEVVAALERRRGFTTTAVRAVLRASEMLGQAMGAAVAKVRDSRQALPSLYSEVIEGNVRADWFEEVGSLLHARLGRVEPRHRPHYTPAERYRILLLKQTHGKTTEETAEALLVSEQTIGRWIDEAIREPDKETIGSLLKASPPVMSYSHLVRDLAVAMGRMGFGGNLKIAQTLARAGIKVSKETVRRWRARAERTPGPNEGRLKLVARVLKAKRPGHIWMLDLTEIRGLFGLFKFKLAVVIGVFSRMPMMGQILTSDPSGEQMANLLELAAAKHGAPKHSVTDQGPQFTSAEFKGSLGSLGVKQRFGAIGKHGSVAIIERFWRTVKETFGLKERPVLTASALQARLELALYYYAYYRPHQGLGGATPAEVYYGRTPAYKSAVQPVRAYENRSDDKLFEIAYLDPEEFLPVLIRKAAA